MPVTLTPEQLAQAVKNSAALNLSNRNVRIIQYITKAPVTGVFDAASAQALSNFIIANEPTATKLISDLQTSGKIDKSKMDADWANLITSLERLVSLNNLANALATKLAELTPANVFTVAKHLSRMGGHTLGLLLCAEINKVPLENAVTFCYDDSLTDLYASRIAFTDMIVTPAMDSKRDRDGKLAIASAPYKEVAVRIGKPAFEHSDKMQQALKFAFGLDVRSLSALRPAGVIMGSQKDKAKAANITRYASKRFLMMLQGAVGAPKSGKWDDDTVNQIASFQKSAGLTADGIMSLDTLGKLVPKVAKEMNLPEVAAFLVAGFYNMREDHLTALAYNPAGQTAVGGSGAIPGTYFVEIGPAAFSMPILELAKALAKHLSALVVYKGTAFTGQHSATLDCAFLPLIQKVNDYANKFGVKIMISGPNASSFRFEGIVVAGAVVKPAARSNHKIGHAIDFNLVADRHYNSAALHPRQESNWGEGVRNFINAIRKDGILRWGGDFATTDPIHIDDGLNTRNTLEYDQRLLATQSAYQLVISQTGTRSLGGASDATPDEEHSCGDNDHDD